MVGDICSVLSGTGRASGRNRGLKRVYEKYLIYNQVEPWKRVLGNSICKGQEAVPRGWQMVQLGHQ